MLLKNMVEVWGGGGEMNKYWLTNLLWRPSAASPLRFTLPAFCPVSVFEKKASQVDMNARKSDRDIT